MRALCFVRHDWINYTVLSIYIANGSFECEYGMYDFSDVTNAMLLSQGWSPLTWSELSGSYRDDFISYFNANEGLYSLITWNSNSCCFSFGELDDAQLVVSHPTVDVNFCMIWPGLGSGSQCNPAGGYAAGVKYNWYSANSCHNGEQVVTNIDPNITFALTTVCTSLNNNNPGIWKRCGNFTGFPISYSTTIDQPTTTTATDYTTTDNHDILTTGNQVNSFFL